MGMVSGMIKFSLEGGWVQLSEYKPETWNISFTFLETRRSHGNPLLKPLDLLTHLLLVLLIFSGDGCRLLFAMRSRSPYRLLSTSISNSIWLKGAESVAFINSKAAAHANCFP